MKSLYLGFGALLGGAIGAMGDGVGLAIGEQKVGGVILAAMVGVGLIIVGLARGKKG